MQKARKRPRSDCVTFGENTAVSILGLLQLLKARERERIPLEWIRPCLLDRKARIIQLNNAPSVLWLHL